MQTSVIGCGRWGSFIAWYLDKRELPVMLYGRSGSKNMAQWQAERSNGLVSLPERVELTTSLSRALSADIIFISIGSQGLRQLMASIAQVGVSGKTFVLCMKGIEIDSGMRLSQIASAFVGADNNVAVWLGPGHVQEFSRGVPNCMVIDSENEQVKHDLVDLLSGDLIRFYYGTDLIGNEIGAAAKNVVGIAAGMLDGLSMGSLKGALMSRGTREIARLICAMGGNELSAYGLCHLGDYEATVFSSYSHNRLFGELFIQGQTYDKLAEGYYTVKALMALSEKHGVELPICRVVYELLYENRRAETVLDTLFLRSIKNEF